MTRRNSIPDNRYHSELPRRRWVPDTVAANQVTDSLPEPVPDLARRLRRLVAMVVNPAVRDYRAGQTTHASDDDFRTALLKDVREYAAEMDLDTEAAEAEARRQLEVYNV